MFTPWCDNLVLIIAIVVPCYIFAGAPYSFLYYAKKSQASPQEIEAFKEKLGFPFRLLFAGSPPLMMRLTFQKTADLNKHINTSRLEEVRFQRAILYSCYALVVFPMILGSLFQSDIILKGIGLFSTLALSGVVYACWRFGHSLQEPSHEV